MNRFLQCFTSVAAVLTLGGALSSCGDKVSEAASDTSGQAAHNDAQIPEIHSKVFEAFDLAAQNTPEGYLQAARRLDQLGAHPMSSKEDRARQWQQQALALKPALAGEANPYRGRVKGPAYREHNLAPGESDVIREVFYAAEPASLSLDPRDTQIIFRVREVGEAKDVCDFASVSKKVSCKWMPIHTAPYEIAVTNKGDKPLTFLLVSN